MRWTPTFTRYLAGLTLAALLSGCANWAPTPSRGTDGEQVVMESVTHWKELANEIASKAIEAQEDMGPTFQSHGGYFVRAKSPDGACSVGGCPSNFQKGFQKLLKTALVESGIPITQNPASNQILKYDVQVVEHNWTGDQIPVPRDHYLDNPLEVLVTVSLMDHNRYLMRSSKIYYVRRSEGFQFRSPDSSTAWTPYQGENWGTKEYEVVDQ